MTIADDDPDRGGPRPACGAPGHAVPRHPRRDACLKFYAIEIPPSPGTRGGPPTGRRLLAVVGDVSEELAIATVAERYGHLFPGQQLTARQTDCLGEVVPLTLAGWITFRHPDKARCPRCRRAFLDIEPGVEWRVRVLTGTQGKRGTSVSDFSVREIPFLGHSHGRHTCTRSTCKAVLEVLVVRSPR